MTMVMLDYMSVQSFMSTHTQCFMLVVKEKIIYVTCPEKRGPYRQEKLRCYALGVDTASFFLIGKFEWDCAHN